MSHKHFSDIFLAEVIPLRRHCHHNMGFLFLLGFKGGHRQRPLTLTGHVSVTGDWPRPRRLFSHQSCVTVWCGCSHMSHARRVRTKMNFFNPLFMAFLLTALRKCWNQTSSEASQSHFVVQMFDQPPRRADPLLMSADRIQASQRLREETLVLSEAPAGRKDGLTDMSVKFLLLPQ